MTFAEFVDWAAGYILQELLAGRFRPGVYMVIDQAIRWQNKELKNEKKKKQ
jgi:hypothetical protein